ncbi:MAG: hypothetical protein LBF54_00755 [Holosporaceae bacterium]|jgi:hypothetical protein|nr:hypothetical protein [Holosporaceae bacterium]
MKMIVLSFAFFGFFVCDAMEIEAAPASLSACISSGHYDDAIHYFVEDVNNNNIDDTLELVIDGLHKSGCLNHGDFQISDEGISAGSKYALTHLPPNKLKNVFIAINLFITSGDRFTYQQASDYLATVDWSL